MKKGLIILANGFEDTEAITTIDILRRAKIELDIVCTDTLEVISQHNVKYIGDFLLKDIVYDDYGFLCIPGGRAVFNVLSKDDILKDLILNFNSKNKLICCICAAPSIPGNMGLFKDIKYTCFKGCNNGIDGIYSKKPVEICKNFITAKSMGYSVDFALKIVEKIKGNALRNEIEKQIFSK